MEALSSFGFTDSAKAAVPDTDVLEARMAVNEVKKELESFSGKVTKDVKKVEEKVDEEKTFLERIAARVGLGGSSAAAPPSIDPKTLSEKTRYSTIMLEISTDNETTDTNTQLIWIQKLDDMKDTIQQISDAYKNEGHVAPVVREIGFVDKDKSESPNLLKYLDDAFDTIYKKTGPIDKYKDMDYVYLLNGVTDDSKEINLVQLIEDYLQGASDSDKAAIAAINLVPSVNAGVQFKGIRIGKSSRQTASEQPKPTDVKIGSEIRKVASERTMGGPTKSAHIKEYSKALMKSKEGTILFLKTWKKTIFLFIFLVYSFVFANLKDEVRKDNTYDIGFFGMSLTPFDYDSEHTENAYKLAVKRIGISHVATSLQNFEFGKILKSTEALSQVAVLFITMLVQNEVKRAEYMQYAGVIMDNLLRGLETEDEFGGLILDDGWPEQTRVAFLQKLQEIRRHIPDTISISSEATRQAEREAQRGPFSWLFEMDPRVINFAADGEEKFVKEATILLMIDQFFQKIACDTQEPGMVVLLSSLRESYGKDLLEKALPIDKKTSVYTAVDVGKKTHRVYFHGGCAQLENVVNMVQEEKQEAGETEPEETPSACPTTRTPRAQKALKNLKKLQTTKPTESLTNYLDYSSLV